MEVFLVRITASQELVGIFASPSEDDLWHYVDEFTDVDACEYTELGPGGFYLEAGAPRVPTVKRYPTEEEDIPAWFANATLSELWLDAFYTGEVEWQPFE